MYRLKAVAAAGLVHKWMLIVALGEVLSFTYFIKAKPNGSIWVLKNRNRIEFLKIETVTALYFITMNELFC